jgi:sorting nexin-25
VSESYFDSALIPVTSHLKSEFEKLNTTATVEQYKKCRNLLFKLQEEVFNEMETIDLPMYVTSTYFTKTPLGKKTRKVSLALLGSVDVDTTETDTERGDDDVSEEVVQAVEDAFTEIMKNPTGLNKKLLAGSGASSFNNELPLLSESSSKENIRHSLFYNDNDSDDRLFDDSTITCSKLEGNDSSNDLLDLTNERQSKQYENRLSRLFETESISDAESITSDSPLIDSIELEENTEGSEVFLAAPGDLSLAEQISKLSQELESLNEQLSVLEPLLRKATLTNNVGELKILKKSKVSLEREIKYKELQMHQYIVQENDNSLYAKSRVSIQSYVIGNDEKQGGKEFVLYIVEVQKLGDDANLVTAGWIVARRFSQFFKLNEYLRLRYDQVNQLKFPKRTVLKAQRQLVELRKTQLEEYLKQLIGMPEVCSDKVFRSFLSSENFNLTNNFEKANSNNNAEYLTKRIYKITEKFGPKSSEHDTIDNLRDMQKELKQFDDSSKLIFVKPICDILITIFRLSKSQSWLRGRALVVILQQVFGTTIEKMVDQQVNKRLRDETAILDLLVMLKNIVFPNGKFKDPPILRTMYERSTARKEARILTTIFINESCSKIFGASNSNYASQKLFSMVQNQYLNKHLLFTIFDEILAELFPEV